MCNDCGERALQLFSEHGQQFTIKASPDDALHVNRHIAGWLILKDSYLRKHHFRLTLLNLFARILMHVRLRDGLREVWRIALRPALRRTLRALWLALPTRRLQ